MIKLELLGLPVTAQIRQKDHDKIELPAKWKNKNQFLFLKKKKKT